MGKYFTELVASNERHASKRGWNEWTRNDFRENEAVCPSGCSGKGYVSLDVSYR